MRCSRFVAGVTACAGLAGAARPAPEPESTQPNVLFVLIDDLGARDLSCYGSSFHETPAIDRLADAGVRFTRAYAPHPRCVPSRASLLVGRFPAAIGCPGGPAWRGGLDTGEATIGEVMRGAGYSTGYIGKWHLGGEGESPREHGFDVSIAATRAGSPKSYFPPYDGPFGGDDEWRSKKKEDIGLVARRDDEYLTERLTGEAIGFIHDHESSGSDRPFFLVLSHYAVHQPIDAKPTVEARYAAKLKAGPAFDGPTLLPRDGVTKARQDDAGYAAMVESVDESIADLLSTLNELGIADETLVIFTSDHGGLSNRGAASRRQVEMSNLPLRAGKGHLYEGGVRVPLIVSWPGVVPAGVVSSAVTVNTDFLPTLAAIAGTSVPDGLDGVDVSGAFFGEPLGVRPAIYWHSPAARPVSTGDHNASAVMVGDWKLVDTWGLGLVELFHIGVDPHESIDLAEHEAGRAADMLRLLNDWRASVNAAGGWRDRADQPEEALP